MSTTRPPWSFMVGPKSARTHAAIGTRALLGVAIVLASCASKERRTPSPLSGANDDAATDGPAKDAVGDTVMSVKAQIAAIERALRHFARNNSGHYPDALDALVTPDVNGATLLNTRVFPKDPWGIEYQYEATPAPDPREPRILTLGKDQRPGGAGENMDIDNWMIRDGQI